MAHIDKLNHGINDTCKQADDNYVKKEIFHSSKGIHTIESNLVSVFESVVLILHFISIHTYINPKNAAII
jgi:hypothetical protein